MAPKVDPMQCHCTPGPGTKEAPSEEVAPWNPSTVRDLPLPEDNGTLHPQGSLYVINKIHALHVEDCKNTRIVVICTNVKDVVEDSKNTCIVVICTNVKDVKILKILVFNPG